jgi:hypothetical protein
MPLALVVALVSATLPQPAADDAVLDELRV